MFSYEHANSILKLKLVKIEVEVKNIEAQPIWKCSNKKSAVAEIRIF